MSKPYLVILERGNDYRCGCCRRTWQIHDIHEFDGDEEIQAYVKQTNESEDDVTVEAIYELAQKEPIV